MRISDWSSDVCSSDLCKLLPQEPQIAPTTTWPTDRPPEAPRAGGPESAPRHQAEGAAGRSGAYGSHRWSAQIGGATSRDSGCQYVSSSVGAVSVKKKITPNTV